MKDPLIFLSSFNRPNLHYEVRAKTKNTVVEIANLISKQFPQDSGLIYCITKKDCSKISEKLKKAGIKADFYHSEVESSKKTEVQNK